MDKQAVTAAGFAPIRRSPRRLIASIQGMIKSGKTRLALTAPKPVGYISIEIGGDEGVADQFIPDQQDFTEDIQIVRIKMDEPAFVDRNGFAPDDKGTKAYDAAVSEAVSVVADAALGRFYDAYYASLENFKTTVVDTGSDLWRLVRLANFGRLEKVPQLAYDQVNKQFEKLIDDAYGFSGNLIFTHHMKEKYENTTNDRGKMESRATGTFVPAGYSGVDKKVQAIIETWRDNLQEPDEVTGMLVKFNAEIVDSRHNAKSMGKKFEYEFTLGEIGRAIMGGTDKDWQ